LQKVLKKTDVMGIRKIVRTNKFFDGNHPIARYITRLVRNTDPYIDQAESLARRIQDEELEGMKLELEASPRAGQWFAQIAGVYVYCILGERKVLPEHIQYLAESVLRHRLTFREKLDHQSMNYARRFIEALVRRTPIYG